MIARELWRCSSRWILLIMSSVLCRSAVGASCVTRLENATAISQCATLCSDQLTNSSAITSITLLVQRQRLSGQCAEHCRLAYTRGMCHCRDGCLDSLPCLTACGLTGSYNGIASNATALKMCVRTMVQPDLTLRTNIYWMPLESDLRLMGMITNSSVYYHAPELHKSESEKEYSISGIALFHYYNISSPLSFPLLKTIRNGSSAGQSVAPYNVGVRVADVTYYMPGAKPIAQQRLDNNRVGGRTGDYVLFSTPECNQVKDHFSKCADPQYADVSSPTQYYDPINVSGFNAKSNTMANPVRAAQQDAPVEQSYQLALALRWTYQLFEHVPRDSAAPGVIAHAYDSCTPHSCWCWESCAVQHRVSLDVIVNDDLAMRYNHTMDFVEEQEDDYVHCPNIRVNRSFSVDIPATNLLLGRIADSSLLGTELVNVSVTASIQSYYVVDKYFGPLQKSSIITYSLVDIPVYLKDPSKEDNDHTSPPSNTSTPPHTAFANTMSSNNTATSRSPGRIPHTSVSAVADGQSVAMEIIVPVVMVILLAVMGVGGLIFIRMWRYQKWRPRCVAKNSTLEKLHQLPVQTITNDGYQALKSDWPAVTRNCINLELQLGSGQFGEVYKATVANLIPREAVTQVAVKVLKQGSSPKDEHDFLLEATHLKNFRHPNVIRLLGVCLDEHPKMIILELMDGGDLLSYLQANQPGAARPAWDDAEYIDIALDITAGLRYLETEKYVHRDVAARNCLVSFCPKNSSLAVKPSSSGRIVKIADFGLARDIDQRHYYRLLPDREALLPLRWLAPESLQKKIFTTKSDVWSFGILLWEIYTYGQLPYGEKTQGHEIYTFVLMGGTLDQPQFCPNAMYKLMKHAWAKSPADRPTFTQLRDHLSTFQNSLSRRKTLLTTLASFASVSGIGEVERANLPHIPPSQRVMVAPRPSSAQGSVFDSESMASDSENVFESPAVTPAVTPLSHRRTAAGFQPQTQPKFSSDFLTIPDAAISTRQLQQHQPQSRKSRCDSATGDGIATSETSPVKTLREFPVTANGISSPGYTAVVSTSHNHLPPFGSTALEQSTPKQRQCSPESHPTPLVITEFASRKTLSPIVSASSTTDDGMEPSSSLLTGARRKTRSTNSSSSRRKPSYSETCL
eukprot:scpid17991/ scgid25433/ Proto-oncogene tyrosine-protein kinase ROS; Proto-oncogene c-Ros; Proto-oncogene c-Ros-1; Receptor tyrosine kinase c-ros oncogene 1; c-Ros receptor tyrosine kinase